MRLTLSLLLVFTSLYGGKEPDLNVTEFPISEASSKYISMVKTGQTKSYADYDDGHYQIGADRSYMRDDAKNTVTESVTGLMWQDDSIVTIKQRSWPDAVTYCENLEMGGYGDWRLPDIKEMGTIVDFGMNDPDKKNIDPAFKHFSAYRWTSTAFAGDNRDAWVQSLGGRLVRKRPKNREYSPRCVRGGKPYEDKTLRYVRDNKNETVTDTVTALSWQDDNAAKSVLIPWGKSLEYCKKLTLGGHDDWRLPNRNEMMSIMDYSRVAPAMDPAFQNIVPRGTYWTSTTSALNTDFAYSGRFDRGEVHRNHKKSSHNVRCVR